MHLPVWLLAPVLQALLVVQQSGRPGARRLRDVCRLHLGADEARALTAVRQVRAALAADRRGLVIQDFGTGTSSGRPETVAAIHARAAVAPAWGRFLFRLVRRLQPRRVLELGTNLGVSGAYLQAALDLNGGAGRLVTLEGDPALAEIARHTFRQVSDTPVEVVTGRFRETLPGVLERHGPFDLVFIDGHHEEQATLDYYAMIAPHLRAPACVVLDDLEPGFKTVRRAWRRIRHQAPEGQAFDFIQFGLFFPHGLPSAPVRPVPAGARGRSFCPSE